jgi:hypothetical protein
MKRTARPLGRAVYLILLSESCTLGKGRFQDVQHKVETSA